MLDQIKIQYYSIPESTDIEMENAQATTFVVLKDKDWSEDNQNLLNKMLKAIKLEDHEVQLIPLSQEQNFSLSSLPSTDAKTTILIFGLTPTDIQLNIRATKYQLTGLERATLIFSDSLSTLIEKPALKKPLWQSLQAAFQ